MKKINYLVLTTCIGVLVAACTSNSVVKEMSGNPIFPGWYADPEGIVFDDEYWIYPTLSMLYGDDIEKYKSKLSVFTHTGEALYGRKAQIVLN